MTVHDRLHEIKARFRALFRRRQLEEDLEAELRFHLARREEDYGAQGLAGDRARAAARRRFGNVAALKEACRDVWTFEPLETLAHDLRFAGRVLWRTPGFTMVAVLSLALGIGASTAMFGVVKAVLLRPLPYPEADRLVRLAGFYPKGAVETLQETSRTMEVAGVGTDQPFNLTGAGEAQRLVGSTVSANFFSVLRRGAALGRVFGEGDDRPGRDRLVVLSHGLWRSRFGGDPAVVGRSIALEGVAREVVGVMPPGFHFPSPATQIWVPLRLDPNLPEDYWGFGWMPAVARLRAGFTVAQAHDELKAAVDRIGGLFPWPAPDWNREAAALPLQEDLVRDLRPKLLVLQSAVLIVLLIACANAGSLLLARAATRGKEMALRATLGARRARIVRQLLTESLLLCALGGVVGIALAAALVSGLASVLPADTRGFARIELDPGVVAFATGLAVLCGLLFGVVPAASASRVDLTAMIKTGGPRSTSRSGTRLRAAFVAGEVALAVVLAVGAGLLLRTLHGLSRVDPGFRAGPILTAEVSPNPAACDERASCVALYDEILRRVVDQGGAEDAAAASALPLGAGQPLLPVEMDGHPLQVAEKVPPLLWAGAVTSGYFRVLGIPVIRGRGFQAEDAEGTAPVAVVSAATARRYWPGQDPIGKRVRVVMEPRWRTVVGVAGDVRHYTLSGKEPAAITGALYLPYPQAVGLDRRIPRVMSLVVKTSRDASSMASRLREVVARVNPEMPVSDVRALEAQVEDSIQEPRVLGGLFAGFAAGALLLAAIGTYGIVSYQAAQRTYEIGVRVAVGATRAQVFGLVVGQGLRLAAVGLALGLAAAMVLGRSLQSFLYGVSAVDPLTLGTVGALLLGTVLLASYLPGRRAAALDPVRALRVD